jgi:hypothetical protein
MPNGNKSGKIPVVSAIIGALCIILYIGALSYGALNIYSSITERRALGDREFDSLADLASAAGVLGFMDERFIQIIQDAIDSSETILGVVISGSKGEFAFEKERGTVITWVNNSPRFVPHFAAAESPNLPLRIEGQRNVNIRAVSGFLDYDFCIEILKRTLLIVLFSLTLAFFTLLMDALLTKNTPKSGERAAVFPRESPKDSAANPSGGSSAGPAVLYSPAKEKQAPGPKEEPSPSGEEPEKPGDDAVEEEIPGGEQTGWNTENFDFEDEDDFPYLEDEKIPGDSDTAAPRTWTESPVSGPQGLFSPRGNVGWESYTRERLESELHRSASIEQDLTVIVMSFKEPEKLSESQFRCFTEEAALYFEHRDLIFEYGERGLWVIQPNHSLEQDLAASEEFNNRILAKLPRSGFSKIDLRFGISSRSGRLINAERIMLEAREALKRAIEDAVSHIVAFKSDPEKYRQYVGSRNSA